MINFSRGSTTIAILLLATTAYGQYLFIPKNPLPRDCGEIYNKGTTQSGVYTIDPKCPNVTEFQVYCNMDNGGGYTVIQRRMDGSEDFHKTWSEYVEGFGELWGEHWIGLDKMHCLTSRRPKMLLIIDLADYHGNCVQVNYSFFHVGGPQRNYTLNVGGFSSSNSEPLLDRLTYHNGMQFTTKDRDNDQNSGNCASSSSQGGWWYKSCYHSDLNGAYRNRYTLGSVYWHNLQYSSGDNRMRFVEMKVLLQG